MKRRGSRDPKVAWLAQHPWWGELSEDELLRLASLGERRDLAADRLIMLQGERGVDAALIVEGEVTVTRAGAVVAWLGPGEIVGELSLLDHVPRTASVRTASEVQLLVLRADDLQAALAEIAPLRERVLALASEHRGPPRPDPGG
jgi:CRP/FNR family transcriptional regulator, cyclic AMP receptor protein